MRIAVPVSSGGPTWLAVAAAGRFVVAAGCAVAAAGRFVAAAGCAVAAAGCVVVAANCAPGAGGTAAPQVAAEFGSYWYRGLAEISRYELQQARYGEIHSGDAVLIFVTEDFLPDRQVKYEGHGSPAVAPVSVLKLNFTRRFDTGIYPYSALTSVFAPVAGGAALKASSSVQEWCGHTYQQLNLGDGGYRAVLHSYFQQEADREVEIAGAILEDELWTRLRLAPDALPLGELRLVPGLQYARFAHRPSRAEPAIAVLSPAEEDGTRVYGVRYRDFPRTLEIRFEAAFPHAIVGWEEHEGGAEPSRTTRARRTHTMLTDYWNKNSVADASYRRQLGLD